MTLARLRDLAQACGFDDAGVAAPQLPEETPRLRQWIAAGYAGSMEWLTRHGEVRVDLRRRFPWARSVIVVKRAYRPQPARPSGPGLRRFVSNYAQGRDYHDVLLPRLRELGDRLEDERGPFERHAYVDTGPALERRLARAAGLGWIGKHTLLLDTHGSYFFLGILVTSLDLPPTPRRVASCGTCRACQPACPTEAFVQPELLDASRCISYLTIEHRGSIDRDLRRAMGEWLFGCDLCQTACPFNYRGRASGDAALGADGTLDLDLPDLLALDDEGFGRRFASSPLSRPKREGLLRNALIVAANAGRRDCLPAARRLLRDPSPVVRETASWCVAELGDASALGELRQAVAREADSAVKQAMAEDLHRLAPSVKPPVT